MNWQKSALIASIIAFVSGAVLAVYRLLKRK